MKKAFYMLRQFALTICFAALPLPVIAADYDLVINNGRVMDPETNLDGIRNVGIKEGRIAVITEDQIVGTEAIDATGLVVAPGYRWAPALRGALRLSTDGA